MLWEAARDARHRSARADVGLWFRQSLRKKVFWPLNRKRPPTYREIACTSWRII